MPTEAKSSVSLSVVMPGFNEEKNVDEAINRLAKAVEQVADPFEIIVVNDGSTDRTGERAEAIAAKDPRVRVLHNEQNVNYGVSLRRGIKAARYDWILHEAMDLPLAPEDLPKFVGYFETADVVVARRADRSAHSPWRKVTSWTNRLLLRLLFAPKTVDLNFVQFYRRSFVQALPVISTCPAFVAPELIMRAERLGKRIHEVEVKFRKRERGEAHFGKLHDILWTLRDMLRFRIISWVRRDGKSEGL